MATWKREINTDRVLSLEKTTIAVRQLSSKSNDCNKRRTQAMKGLEKAWDTEEVEVGYGIDQSTAAGSQDQEVQQEWRLIWMMQQNIKKTETPNGEDSGPTGALEIVILRTTEWRENYSPTWAPEIVVSWEHRKAWSDKPPKEERERWVFCYKTTNFSLVVCKNGRWGFQLGFGGVGETRRRSGQNSRETRYNVRSDLGQKGQFERPADDSCPVCEDIKKHQRSE